MFRPRLPPTRSSLLRNLGICWALSTAAAACGGTTSHPGEMGMGGSAGSSVVVGTSGTTMTTPGGASGAGVGGQGSSGNGGVTSAGASTGCAAAAPAPVRCASDSQCVGGQYCDTESCGSNCTCINGQLACSNVCVFQCRPIACTAAGEAIRAQLTGANCDVVARVNSDATQILGYRVVCGDGQTVSTASLAAQLAPSSRVNWSQASVYGSAADAAYLFVHASNPYDVIAFSESTGETLFEFGDGLSPMISGTWSPPTDLDGSCKGPRPTFQSLGPWDPSYPGQAAVDLLYRKGVIERLNQSFGGYRTISVVRSNLPTVEYFVIVSTFIHV